MIKAVLKTPTNVIESFEMENGKLLSENINTIRERINSKLTEYCEAEKARNEGPKEKRKKLKDDREIEE